MLQVNQLAFERNQELVFKPVDFSLQSREALQIVGPNGCGKTTLLQMLCGLSLATQGEINWQGKKIQDQWELYRGCFHYLGHKNGIRLGLTVLENLEWMASLQNRDLNQSFRQVLQTIGLSAYERHLTRHLSAGQLRRLMFAKLLLVKASIWFLDEPFTALDKTSAQTVEKIILQQLEQGGMVVFTSHQEFNLSQISLKKLQLDFNE